MILKCGFYTKKYGFFPKMIVCSVLNGFLKYDMVNLDP